MPRNSLKSSQRGKQLIKEAKKKLIQKHKTTDINRIVRKEASNILEPEKNYDNVLEEHYAVSLSTLRRFQEGKPITASTFKTFCEVLNLNWEDLAENETDANIDLSEAPFPVNFYGRTQELAELERFLIQQNSRLVLIYGMGGIGKSTLARHLVDRVASRYNRLIWLSLESAPPFQQILIRLLQLLSKGEQEEGFIDQIMQYLHQQRCLIVLDSWEEIIDNNSGAYKSYNVFVERVAKEPHRSSLLLLSRRKPDNIEILQGQFVYSKRILPLTQQEVKEFLSSEGLFGTDIEIERFSERYNNPWILKRIIQSIHNVFNGDISLFVNNNEFSIVLDELTTVFLDQQFETLSQAEINLIYWVAIRRNTALWDQLVQDSKEIFTYQQLFENVNSLIGKHSLISKNTQEIPVIYILEPVILKYSLNRFVKENYVQINQIFETKNINGYELFLTHRFITQYPKDEELNQEQTRRIVTPLQRMLAANFRSQQKLENQLTQILSMLKDKELSHSCGYQNISQLISACQQI
ncbi:NB-ARC domain-containing protein [Aetokthonos hydrillicola Thurmond2011]|jgi:DNA-binding Xre family transcriptional regulator|uniref:NB-ARC domain-containing protein n=1 Tax=Aetokthonos hydrillicola Thurmond2011 TaxID=2712845 RepID=A0AAP5I5P1_9CYAN|nr:ATP-binding protein [Aetokthonos hydrillicola]MBO3461516.1 NACHT domain-containing protein [Aetokthonos hydrillicola CCALA 1050]MBW4584655.1 NACHT domain-containing protein [Aetokthonos hydrillicola CCALA 1050]MDR9895199.1 NB-ARC domain-containing protein [Aetokthonos hydrillicola Thurmond2011]